MTDEIKRWFCDKISQNPEYLGTTYLPEIEKTFNKAEAALREAIRNGTIEKIKYSMGWLDGVQQCISILDGLKLSEGKKPAEPGLMARIFSGGMDRS